MGRDKAALELGGRTLLERAVTTLSAVAPQVVLASGTRARYAELGCEIALDRWHDAGPLAGLEAGMTLVQERALGEGTTEAFVVVLPCDMPRVDSALLQALLARALSEQDVSASLFTSDRGPEPLCGVYHTRALPAIRAALRAGQRAMLSFMEHPGADGELPRVLWTDVAEACAGRSLARPALNLNSLEDLSSERALWAAQETA
jgi:molybdopterin-guanine dinucleotide biosynthesis protein A